MDPSSLDNNPAFPEEEISSLELLVRAALASVLPESKIFVDNSATISNRIEAIMKAKRIKPAALAAKLGKSRAEVRRWLSGTHNLTIRTIATLEIALGETLIIALPPSADSVKVKAFFEQSETMKPFGEDQKSRNAKTEKNKDSNGYTSPPMFKIRTSPRLPENGYYKGAALRTRLEVIENPYIRLKAEEAYNSVLNSSTKPGLIKKSTNTKKQVSQLSA